MASIDPQALDAADPLKWARDEFEIPLKSDSGGDGMSPNPFIPEAGTLTVLMDARRRRGHLSVRELAGAITEASS